MNYFNYFTEIEDEFVKRRGSHLLISPLDWSLIETWKQRGIPLHIVLRGINSSFDAYDARAQRVRKINSLMYCQQEVEAMYLDYCEAHVGAGNSEQTANGQHEPDPQFSRQIIAEHLREQLAILQRLQTQRAEDQSWQETFARAITRLNDIIADLQNTNSLSPERLEADLTLLEALLLEGVQESAGADVLQQLRQEAQKQLRAYRQTMEPPVYEQTLANFVARRLREQFRIPRLSLFYLS